MPVPALPSETPSLAAIRDKAHQVFSKRPCLWQLKIAEAFLKGDQDIVCIAGTEMGKTLTFWLPLLFCLEGIQIVVTPLNQLGQQNVDSLRKAGIRSIAINAETATLDNFQAIANLEYRAVIVSPEQLMKPGGEFQKLLTKEEFTSHVISFVFDEAYCIMSWGELRPEYKELQQLCYIISYRIPYMIASATLTPELLCDVKKLLHLRSENLLTIHTSTDRPNLALCIRKIKYTLSTYADLGFLVPLGWKEGDLLPPKFLIFFDDIQDAWFNSDMTTDFKQTEATALVDGGTINFLTTESFGMGMDVSDIVIVGQWRATCNLSTIWQQWGRAARDRGLPGHVVLFAEKDYFDDVREAKHQRKAKKTPTAQAPTTKRRACPTGNGITAVPVTQCQPVTRLQDVAESGGPLDIESSEEDESGLSDIGERDIVMGMEDAAGHGKDTADGGKGAGEVIEKELREMMQAKPDKKPQKRCKVLDPAMDFLINAHLRTGFHCRRKVFDLHFNNAAADVDHRACDPSNQGGCSRCAPLTTSVCCDIHHPDAFHLFDSSFVPVPKLPNRSRLNKFKMGPKEYELCEALEDWREGKTREIHGELNLIDIGPSLVMPDDILDRIVTCAHYLKIKSVDDLRRETHWSKTNQFGAEVISVIHHIIPIPITPAVFTTTPLQSRCSILQTSTSFPVTPSVNLSTSRQLPAEVGRQSETTGNSSSKKNKCSACGLEGHNRHNRTACTMHPDYSGKENYIDLFIPQPQSLQ
ncbi:hypothetical protein PAXINDRAFT_14203 [Paxillus involutus ATCC 200175]|uniref:DNA 3'-5' helicase n=1 Tax=Paxillus involutus ATCC 200175 TaxID=664439 RepID=A0A0C9TBM4_PAXIN|nr:hypothetical protein PAXINDRAFT_14203 [Paxillus involutus ATCC 200175]